MAIPTDYLGGHLPDFGPGCPTGREETEETQGPKERKKEALKEAFLFGQQLVGVDEYIR